MVLTVEQLAEHFQLSRKTVYWALERRDLRAAEIEHQAQELALGVAVS